GVQQNVARFEIAMEHAALMSVVHGARDGADQLYRSLRWPVWTFISDFGFRISDLTQRFAQIRPFNQAHAEIVLPLVLPDFVDRHNVRMRRVRRRFSLSFEPLDEVWAGECARADELERNQSIQADLTRFEHNAHPAAGDFF